MRPLKINYISISENPDNLDLLVREYDTVDKRQNYNKCPVYRHKKTRTFVSYSPVDFEMHFESDHILTSKPLLASNETVDGVPNSEYVFQLSLGGFAFWTDEPDVWMEFNSHPLTSLKNNFTVVEGWFNLSNWSRNTILTIRVVDKTKPVIINQGDPLFRLNFLSPDLNRGVILEEKDLSYQDEYELSKSQNFREGNKLFSKTKKCPFRFLHK